MENYCIVPPEVFICSISFWLLITIVLFALDKFFLPRVCCNLTIFVTSRLVSSCALLFWYARMFKLNSTELFSLNLVEFAHKFNRVYL